jgi:hypothetical protein
MELDGPAEVAKHDKDEYRSLTDSLLLS